MSKKKHLSRFDNYSFKLTLVMLQLKLKDNYLFEFIIDIIKIKRIKSLK